jgi:hypothetical protein
VDAVVQFLWQKTDASLLSVRNHLEGAFRRSLDGALDDLVREIPRICGTNGRELVTAVTTTQTILHGELGVVSSWFSRGDASSAENFNISFAVDLATEMVNRCYAHRTLEIARNYRDTANLSGQKLYPLVTALFLMFDNAMEHGRAWDGRVHLKLDIEALRPQIVIKATNQVREDEDRHGTEARLIPIREEISGGVSSERVRSEDGTGLAKIARISRVDLGRTSKLTFGFSGEREFEVVLSLNEASLWA